MEDCIFCKLANGEIPTDVVYEDDLIAVFRDACLLYTSPSPRD